MPASPGKSITFWRGGQRASPETALSSTVSCKYAQKEAQTDARCQK